MHLSDYNLGKSNEDFSIKQIYIYTVISKDTIKTYFQYYKIT